MLCMRSTGEACSVGNSTAEWLLLRLFKLSARTSRGWPLGVVGRERPPPPALPRDSRRTRLTGPLTPMLAEVMAAVDDVIPLFLLLLLLLMTLPLRGSELVKIGRFLAADPEDGDVISWIGSRLEDRMGEPSLIGCWFTETPAAEACKNYKKLWNWWIIT